MPGESLVIYRSSAGSGKTYTLTREYLRLALSSNEDKKYRKILAVTFTNKAMQEMKDRIVLKLADFRNGDLSGMGEELINELQLDREAFRERAGKLLSSILHDYGHFSITTIDAFFQRVIRSFARELGLAGSYRLDLDVDMTLHHIVHDLMNDAEKDEELKRWLIDFSHNQLKEGGSWVIENKLEEFTKKLLNEDFLQHEGKIESTSREDVHRIRKELYRETARVKTTMENIARQGLSLMEQYGLTPQDFTQINRGPGIYFKNILEGKFPPNSYIRTSIEEDSYAGAGKKKSEKVEAALTGGLRKIFNDLLSYWDAHSQTYQTQLEILKKFYLFGLTLDILQKMEAYKKEHDIMFISDATRLLTELVVNTDALFIYEKVGSFFDHFLIDEFQDTSTLQWKSFSPLVENSLAEGNANLIVGDVKQSIYRWRGGELELLQEGVEKQIGSSFIRHEQLRTNYRSEATIVNFNNAIFETIPKLISGVLSEGTESAGHGRYIGEVYHDVRQQARSGDDGYVHIEFVESGRSNEWMERTSERLRQIIEKLQDKGVPLGEIAILVRDNKEGQLAADYLSDYAYTHRDNGYRYDVISNDSLFLAGSPALRLITAALRYLQSPRNALNRADLAYHYNRINGGSGEELSELLQQCRIRRREEEPVFTTPEKLLNELVAWDQQPFIELVEKLIHVFGLSAMPDQYAFLQTFQDHVLSFVSRERGDIPSFLDWWELRASKESIKVPNDLDAIRIMTIHKAKGLEFHSVIMPYTSWKLDHKINPVLWLNSDEPPVEGVVPIGYSKNLLETRFSEPYLQEKLKIYTDNLNILYVAFTRASHDLWILAPEKTGNITSINDLLQATLENPLFPLSDSWKNSEKLFTSGNPDFTYTHTHEKKPEPVRLTQFNESRWQEKLILKPVSRSLIQSEARMKINTGIVIHQLLSRVRYLSDFEKVLRELSWEAALSEEEVSRIKQHVRTALERPSVREWFSRRWKVMNESTILTTDREYRPDRVLLDGREGIIIDYKTGMQRNTDVVQMQQYKSLLASIEEVPVKGYLWYIDLNEIVEV